MKNFLATYCLPLLHNIWDYISHQALKLAEGALWLIVTGYVAKFMRRFNMEKELVKGAAGGVKVTISEGKARIEAEGHVPGDVGITAGGFVQCDAEVLVNKIFAEIEAKTPDAIDTVLEMGKPALIAALKNIK
jgi:hypothetical protein